MKKVASHQLNQVRVQEGENTVATHNSNTPNRDPISAILKMSLFEYVKDFEKKSIDFLKTLSQKVLIFIIFEKFHA